MSLVLKPRLSEKAYALSQEANVYVFEVDKSANKLTVADAVAEQFKVTVVSVNMTNVKGKKMRTFVNRRGKFVRGSRSDIKKAYVTVKAGENIPVFAADEEAEAKAEKVQKQVDKAAAKEAEKVEKPKKGILRRKAPAPKKDKK